jgi:hypothetical protein
MTAEAKRVPSAPFSVRIENRPKPVYDVGEGRHYDRSVAEWLSEDGDIVVYIYPAANGDGAFEHGYQGEITDSVLQKVKDTVGGFKVEYEEFIPALILSRPDSVMIDAEPMVVRAVHDVLVVLGIRQTQ